MSIAKPADMPPRLALGCALGLVCAGCAQNPGSHDQDAGPDLDAGIDTRPPDDGTIDAPPDAPTVDTTPPQLVSISPASGSAAWLHDSIRLVFDEPIKPTANVDVTFAGAALTASVSREGDRTLVIGIENAARGLGTLDVRVAGIHDLADNVLATPVTAQYTIEPWFRTSVDRGAATSSPAIAVADDGAVTAAWTVGGQLAISRLASGAWQSLGGTLGTAAVSPAIALDAAGAPIVGYIDGGTAHVARWTGSTWADLPALGAGSQLALASPIGGGTVVALVIDGSTARVAALVNDQWTNLGGSVAVGGALVGAPALATPADSTAVVGWITQAGGAHTLRTFRFTAGAWTTLSPIALGTSPAPLHLSLAARGTTLALAWDQFAGSLGVFAAKTSLSATSWTRLGHAMDVDVAGDASQPAITLDAAGTPIVAWREKIETNERGILAKWGGSAWQILGGRTWLPAPSATPLPTHLGLQGGSPVVAWTAAGAIGIAEFNGPKTAGFGLDARAPLSGCSFDAANPPARVLQTGCFTLAAPGKPTPHAGLVPYDIVVELWSDGAKKRRWIALPAGQSMTLSGTGAWAPPVGTFIVKEFAIETTPGNAATRRVVETRFLKLTSAGWQGFSYRWRADGSDADLLTDGTFTQAWSMDDGSTYTHIYPSRSQCVSCHESSYGPMLGIRPQQLQRWFDYNGIIADQLPTLAHLNVGPDSSVAPFPAAHDPSNTVEQRVRAYMAANCAHCHNPNHIAIKDLRFTTPLAQTNLCASIVPGSPEQSVVYARVSQRPGMPPLATLIPDPLASSLIYTWIANMTSCP
ncbi:MAG TPA: Ig-like domain-containing protein [Kofleriaceae bacterium]|nr:Ig-like domain-containing protein [Kofleriaceae bacterium]